MSKELNSWQFVVTGLHIKTVALWLLLASPVLTVALSWLDMPETVLVACLLPLFVDFAGRCCCLAMPRPLSKWLVYSVVAQLAGILGLSGFGLAGPLGLILGVFWAVAMQGIAAALFTTYLQGVALQLNRADLLDEIDHLRNRLMRSAFTGFGFGIYAIVSLIVAFCLGVLVLGIGWVITVPLAVLMLIPLGGFALAVLMLMFSQYDRTLSALRQAMRDANCIDSPFSQG